MLLWSSIGFYLVVCRWRSNRMDRAPNQKSPPNPPPPPKKNIRLVDPHCSLSMSPRGSCYVCGGMHHLECGPVLSMKLSLVGLKNQHQSRSVRHKGLNECNTRCVPNVWLENTCVYQEVSPDYRTDAKICVWHLTIEDRQLKPQN